MLAAEINVVLIATSIRFYKSILCFLCRNHKACVIILSTVYVSIVCLNTA